MQRPAGSFQTLSLLNTCGWIACRGITGRLTMQIYPDLPEVPIF